jgi:hypothetical protein
MIQNGSIIAQMNLNLENTVRNDKVTMVVTIGWDQNGFFHPESQQEQESLVNLLI